MYVNNELVKEFEGIAQIRRFVSNNYNKEFEINHIKKGIIDN